MTTRIHINPYVIAAYNAIDREQYRLADCAIALICGFQVFSTASGDMIAAAPGCRQAHPISSALVPLPHYTTQISGAALLYFAAPDMPIDSVDPRELVEFFLATAERLYHV